jgi:hypothetical protein
MKTIFFAIAQTRLRVGNRNAPGRSRSNDKQNPKAMADPIIEEPPKEMKGMVMPLAGTRDKFTAI